MLYLPPFFGLGELVVIILPVCFCCRSALSPGTPLYEVAFLPWKVVSVFSLFFFFGLADSLYRGMKGMICFFRTASVFGIESFYCSGTFVLFIRSSALTQLCWFFPPPVLLQALLHRCSFKLFLGKKLSISGKASCYSHPFPARVFSGSLFQLLLIVF